jgi:hypothetical protein
VGFVKDVQVHVATEKAIVGILDSGDPRNRHDDLIPLLPWIHAVIGTKHVAANDLEPLSELLTDDNVRFQLIQVHRLES